jgi:hypothetical protein
LQAPVRQTAVGGNVGRPTTPVVSTPTVAPIRSTATESGASRVPRMTDLVGDLIEQHWPAIEKVLREQVAPRAMAAATNDELIETVAKTLHPLLPLPVRIVIRPQRLANWCLGNRDRILRVLRPRESKR